MIKYIGTMTWVIGLVITGFMAYTAGTLSGYKDGYDSGYDIGYMEAEIDSIASEHNIKV